MKKSYISLLPIAAIFLVLVGACVVILLQKGMKGKYFKIILNIQL